ncbi:MAG: LytTR family DNA-binding domain-containing protein [Bacteroidota bacterium]
MIKAIIVEDQAEGLNNLKNILRENCPDVQVAAEASSVAEAVKVFRNPNLQIDVAFLDIHLKDGLIFEALNQLPAVNFEIIFVTAFEKYAIKACQYASIGFVMKPIDADELADAVKRIPKQNDQMPKRYDLFSKVYNNPNAFEKLSISAIDGIYFVHIRDVLRLEAEDNYTHIYLKNGSKITASRTIKWYEELLEPMNFYRVHKRHVINLNYMQKFVKGDGGYLVMDDGKNIEVSRRRRPAFMEQMRKLQEGI